MIRPLRFLREPRRDLAKSRPVVSLAPRLVGTTEGVPRHVAKVSGVLGEVRDGL
jgi:hypothetical protein